MFSFRWLFSPRPIRRTPVRHRRPSIERLEGRELLAGNFAWLPNAVNSNWNDARNWDRGSVPTGDGTEILTFDNGNGAAAVRTTNNNITTGNSYAGIVVIAGNTGGFTIGGSALIVGASGIKDATLVTGQSNRFTVASVTLGVNTSFDTDNLPSHLPNARLDFTGTTVNLNNLSVTLSGPGTIQFGAVNRGGNGGQLNAQGPTVSVAGVLSGGSGGTAVNVDIGTVTLSGNNTFVGAVNVGANVAFTGATVVATANNAFGTNGSNAVTVSNGATVVIDPGATAITLPQAITLNFVQGGTLRKAAGPNVVIPSNVNSLGGPANALTINGPSGGMMTLTRPIGPNPTGNAPLNVTGSAFTLALQNSVVLLPSSIGDVTVGAGTTLQLGFGASAPVAIPANLTINGTVTFTSTTNGQIAATSNVIVNQGGTLNLNGRTNTIASLGQTTAAGGVVSLGGGTLTVNNATANSYNGTFNGAGALNKTNGGALTLGGNSPTTFTATNNVMAGSEVVNGTQTNSNVNLSGGATLAGIGTVGNVVTTAAANTIVAPGPVGTTTGILSGKAVTLDASAKFSVVLNAGAGTASPAPGTDFDQLRATGAVDLNLAVLEVILGPAFAARTGRSFTILTSTSTVSDAFASIPRTNPPQVILVGSSFFAVRYTANAVILDEIAAPTTTTLTINPTTAVFGQTITLTAQVNLAPPGSGPATSGTVTFKNGAAILGTANVDSSGQAVLMFGAADPLPVGPYSQVVAVYDGNATFGTSQSSPVQTITVTRANTTTDLTPPTSTIAFGEPGTLAATVNPVSPGAGTPTGDVEFAITGPVNRMQTRELVGNTARPDLSSLLPNATPYNVTATYQGNGNFIGSTSNTVMVTVDKANTSTTVTVTPLVSNLGETVAYSATIRVPSAAAALVNVGGSVTFTAVGTGGPTALGTGTIFTALPPSVPGFSDFRVDCPAPAPLLPAGTYTVTATYSGDTNYGTSTSPAKTQVVNQASPEEPIVSLTTPVPFGTLPLTYTARLIGIMGFTPTGLITFYDGDVSRPLGSSSNWQSEGSDYVVTITYDTPNPALVAGDHLIFARFDGDANYPAADSDFVHQIVTKATSSITVASVTPNPSTHGTLPIDYVAEITVSATAAAAMAPTGTVTFQATSTTRPLNPPINLGSVPSFTMTSATVFEAKLTYTGPALPADVYRIVAVYSGDVNYDGSTSPDTTTQTVLKSATTTAILTIDPNPSNAGTLPITYVAEVTGPTTGETMTGRVIFRDGARVLGTANLVGGGGTYSATLVYNGPALAGGNHSITATYEGDDNYQASLSPAVIQTILERQLSVKFVTPPVTIKRGTVVPFLIEVSNTGNLDSTGAFLVQRLPAFTFFNVLNSTRGWVNRGRGVFTFNLGTLRAGETRRIFFGVTVAAVTPPNQKVVSLVSIRDDRSPLADLAAALANITIIPRYPRWPYA